MGVQKHHNKRFAKKSRRKGFKNQKPILFCHCCWAFLGERSSKTRQKIPKKTNLTLDLFWPLTHPPTTGVTD
jgi:hypothetical protein